MRCCLVHPAELGRHLPHTEARKRAAARRIPASTVMLHPHTLHTHPTGSWDSGCARPERSERRGGCRKNTRQLRISRAWSIVNPAGSPGSPPQCSTNTAARVLSSGWDSRHRPRGPRMPDGRVGGSARSFSSQQRAEGMIFGELCSGMDVFRD